MWEENSRLRGPGQRLTGPLRKILFCFLIILAGCSVPSKVSAFFWTYYTEGIRGSVSDVRSGLPLENATVSYDIYRGVGDIYRPAFRIFKHVETTTDKQGQYYLPSVWKFYWLIQPGKIPCNCFMPGLGMHAGFSVSDVTIFKQGYRSLKVSKQGLELTPERKLWPKE